MDADTPTKDDPELIERLTTVLISALQTDPANLAGAIDDMVWARIEGRITAQGCAAIRQATEAAVGRTSHTQTVFMALFEGTLLSADDTPAGS